MASLVPTPKYLYDAFEYIQGENWADYSKRSGDAFRKLQEESDSLPDTEIKGSLIYFPWADGSAIYKVASVKPLKLMHIPYGDAWQVHYATIRGLRLADVERMARSHRAFKKIFSEEGK